MFPWHSTVVAPSRPAERWDPAAPRPANPSPQDASVSSSERIFQQAYRAMVDAGIDLEREATGRLKNPAPMLRAVEREGVKFGPQGAGMLIALADRVPVRPPTKEEFMRCCLQEGTVHWADADLQLQLGEGAVWRTCSTRATRERRAQRDAEGASRRVAGAGRRSASSQRAT